MKTSLGTSVAGISRGIKGTAIARLGSKSKSGLQKYIRKHTRKKEKRRKKEFHPFTLNDTAHRPIRLISHANCHNDSKLPHTLVSENTSKAHTQSIRKDEELA
jgi:hypothetical protein